jgi:hypothetical protein
MVHKKYLNKATHIYNGMLKCEKPSSTKATKIYPHAITLLPFKLLHMICKKTVAVLVQA